MFFHFTRVKEGFSGNFHYDFYSRRPGGSTFYHLEETLKQPALLETLSMAGYFADIGLAAILNYSFRNTLDSFLTFTFERTCNSGKL